MFCTHGLIRIKEAQKVSTSMHLCISDQYQLIVPYYFSLLPYFLSLNQSVFVSCLLADTRKAQADSRFSLTNIWWVVEIIWLNMFSFCELKLAYCCPISASWCVLVYCALAATSEGRCDCFETAACFVFDGWLLCGLCYVEPCSSLLLHLLACYDVLLLTMLLAECLLVVIASTFIVRVDIYSLADCKHAKQLLSDEWS